MGYRLSSAPIISETVMDSYGIEAVTPSISASSMDMDDLLSRFQILFPIWNRFFPSFWPWKLQDFKASRCFLPGRPGAGEAPCGGAAHSQAEEAQEVGGSEHQPHREVGRCSELSEKSWGEDPMIFSNGGSILPFETNREHAIMKI